MSLNFLVHVPFSTMIGMSGGGGGDGGFMSMIVMMAIIFGIFYFLVIRPQRQQQSEHQEMIENLETGDRVVTVGGIHGTIKSISEETVGLQVVKDMKLTVSKDKIASVKNSSDNE